MHPSMDFIQPEPRTNALSRYRQQSMKVYDIAIFLFRYIVFAQPYWNTDPIMIALEIGFASVDISLGWILLHRHSRRLAFIVYPSTLRHFFLTQKIPSPFLEDNTYVHTKDMHDSYKVFHQFS